MRHQRLGTARQTSRLFWEEPLARFQLATKSRRARTGRRVAKRRGKAIFLFPGFFSPSCLLWEAPESSPCRDPARPAQHPPNIRPTWKSTKPKKPLRPGLRACRQEVVAAHDLRHRD
ncbi:hypothetical protein ZHAS_00013335 [Anopheles sinensis]|uniref:Uncharacterized protein n=1 Tax=Anopheles sinensis TaxID=74873 RepID=A0A084W595_ANOSI|nr:hypothetical protein ZHAS_00013335 [Anopheles sinensis]